MNIIAMSDLHGYLPEIEPCELVIICGDSVPLNVQNSFHNGIRWYRNKFKPWAEKLSCNKVLFIFGNHELLAREHEDTFFDLFPYDSKVTLLHDSEYIYNSLDKKSYRIYGTPWCKQFGRWAYMASDDKLVSIYKNIPKNLDILITHDQPFGYGDILLQQVPWADGTHIGNKPLAEAIKIKQPKYLFCGHLHSTTHDEVLINKTKRYNVSIKDEDYFVTYPPLQLEIN